MSLSIRWRLTLWNTAGLAVMLLAFGVLIYGLLNRALYRSVDRSLLSGFQEFESDKRLAQDPMGRLTYRVRELKEHANLLCVVYDRGGKVVASTAGLTEMSFPPAPSQVPDQPLCSISSVPSLGRQRVLTGQVKAGDYGYTVLLMASLAETDHARKELVTTLLTAGPVMLVLSSGLGYFLARKALAPVDQLRRLTDEITAERLDRRLPIANRDDELGRLTQTINAMIGRLERSFNEIRRFTADASHELRTPLTAIRTETEVALRQSLTVAEHRNLLESILEECERLTRLTDQLLILSREDVGLTRESWKPLDLQALVRGVAETMRPLAEAKGVGISIQLQGAPTIRGDESRLRQVFYNLLDNAIKYTPSGGKVEIGVQQTGSDATVWVRDTGIGIPEEHLPYVFDRFYRVDKPRTRAEGGTGLGLSIAQSIVDAHQGRIVLQSEQGKGTVCRVTLPSQ